MARQQAVYPYLYQPAATATTAKASSWTIKQNGYNVESFHASLYILYDNLRNVSIYHSTITTYSLRVEDASKTQDDARARGKQNRK
jgi:hypothetical protein